MHIESVDLVQMTSGRSWETSCLPSWASWWLLSTCQANIIMLHNMLPVVQDMQAKKLRSIISREISSGTGCGRLRCCYNADNLFVPNVSKQYLLSIYSVTFGSFWLLHYDTASMAQCEYNRCGELSLSQSSEKLIPLTCVIVCAMPSFFNLSYDNISFTFF